jgi:hypothetical protein
MKIHKKPRTYYYYYHHHHQINAMVAEPEGSPLLLLSPPLDTILDQFHVLSIPKICFSKNSTIFRGVQTCSLVEVYRCFGRTYCFHLPGRVSQAKGNRKLCGPRVENVVRFEDGKVPSGNQLVQGEE